MPVRCRLCSELCTVTWWDTSVCFTRRKWEVRMSAEGKLRRNNNQQSSMVAAEKRKVSAWLFLSKTYVGRRC